MRSTATRLVLVVSIALLGACSAADGRYPSLARREIERVTASPSVPPPPVPPKALSAELLGRAGALSADARRAHARFTDRRAQSSQAVAAASGAAVASEQWSLATAALAQLEASRSEAMVALAGLDRIYIDARYAGTDVSPLNPLLAEVKGMVAEEDAVIAALAGQIAR